MYVISYNTLNNWLRKPFFFFNLKIEGNGNSGVTQVVVVGMGGEK